MFAISVFPNKRLTAWLAAGAWTAVIFVSIPLARLIQAHVTAWCGRQAFSVIVVLALAAVIVCALRRLRVLAKHERSAAFIWLVLIAAAYLGWIALLRANPEESLHFIEYGVLAVLVFRALSIDIHDPLALASTLLVTSIVGTVDEIIQWLTPNRFFDYRDIILNSGSALLMVLAIAKAWRPAFLAQSPTSRSLEFFSSAAAVQVLLLALCLSNTPQVTARASTLIPPLGYLLAKNDPMTEYGLRHHDDEAGVFFSRFSKTELAQNDLLRSDEAPAIFARYKNRPYNEFLAAYTPYTDPFLHEMRVRIFRRDAHWRKALAQHGAPASMRPHCTIAFYENLILEKYFGQSLRKSMHVLPAKKAAVLESCAVRPTHYKSPVSANLIVHFNPFLVWITAVVLLALFAYLRKSVLRHLAERDG